jgi:hypothetical protein
VGVKTIPKPGVINVIGKIARIHDPAPEPQNAMSFPLKGVVTPEELLYEKEL